MEFRIIYSNKNSSPVASKSFATEFVKSAVDNIIDIGQSTQFECNTQDVFDEFLTRYLDGTLKREQLRFFYRTDDNILEEFFYDDLGFWINPPFCERRERVARISALRQKLLDV